MNNVVHFIDITTDEWNFYILPLDDDILSLELPEFFRDNFLVIPIRMKYSDVKMFANKKLLLISNFIFTGGRPALGDYWRKCTTSFTVCLWVLFKGVWNW